MKTEMEILRANMMKNGVFPAWQLRQIKTLTPHNEAQRKIVQNAFPRGHVLRDRMEACGDVDSWGNINYCQVPLCPRCHLRQRVIQTGKAIKKVFAGTENDELAFATILLPVQMDFSGMSALIETEKRRLRTFVDRQRKKDSRWNDFQLLGWWEIDRMNFADYETSGRNTCIALDDLGFPLIATADATIWRPHLHAIIRRGSLTTDEIAKALRKETHSGRYQVDIQPFHTHRPVGRNIQSIVRYCLKFRIESNYKCPDAQDFIEGDQKQIAGREWWPEKDITAYAEWLCLERADFQSLRVLIGQAKAKSDEVQSVVSSCSIESEDNKDGCSPLPSVESRDRSLLRSIKPECHRLPCELNGGNVFVFASECECLSSRLSVYNNILQDTNWTGMEPEERSPDDLAETMPMEKPSGYSGNFMSFQERLSLIKSRKGTDGASPGAALN